ncbi:MAG: DPP IV N-terminal domain-containing protein [Prevotellaceae bacterium]|nr:DPP IV N-terminal domain-containing protein [Prevotellaceae bacterium]
MTILMAMTNPLNAQKLFTLEDLMAGGNNAKTMRIENPSLKWVGEELQRKTEADNHLDKNNNPYAEVIDHQLYVTNADGKTMQITTDGSREIVYGEAVHRNEFGIEEGLFWSNDRSKLAFYRMDQSMVTDYPQVDINTACASYEPDKYPMAGQTSHEVTIGIFDVKAETIIYLNVGNPKDRYFTNICWSPDNKKVYLFEVNRDQTDTSLDCYDAESGQKIATLYTEHDDKYVEPSHPIMFLPWDASQFIMQSQKDGYNSIYLCKTKDNSKVSGSWTSQAAKPITRFQVSCSLKRLATPQYNDYVVTEVYGFNSKSKSVILQAVKSDSRDYNLYSVNTKNGKWSMLTNGKGVHRGLLSPSGRQIVDNYSDIDTPRQIDIIDIETGKRTPYLTAKNTWEGFAVPTFRTGTVKSADGKTDLFYRMVLPYNFDESKKYPTIVYVYGGPHAHNVQNSWNYGYRPWEVYMSQKGYIVFILDNRGSEDRGKEFEQVTFRQLGQEEMKDQIKGVEYLKTLPYVDADRLGVHGWSFGGFMTTSLMLNYPGLFKVAVAGGPVIDWKYYEVMYGERYMDTPQTNPEGYAKTSLLDKAGNLDGKLLIIHGANDKTVVPQHSLQFLKAAIDANKQLDFFIYPEEPHNMRKHRSVHLHEKITQYFLDYL